MLLDKNIIFSGKQIGMMLIKTVRLLVLLEIEYTTEGRECQ